MSGAAAALDGSGFFPKNGAEERGAWNPKKKLSSYQLLAVARNGQ